MSEETALSHGGPGPISSVSSETTAGSSGVAVTNDAGSVHPTAQSSEGVNNNFQSLEEPATSSKSTTNLDGYPVDDPETSRSSKIPTIVTTDAQELPSATATNGRQATEGTEPLPSLPDKSSARRETSRIEDVSSSEEKSQDVSIPQESSAALSLPALPAKKDESLPNSQEKPGDSSKSRAVAKAAGKPTSTSKKNGLREMWRGIFSCCLSDDVQEGPSSRKLQQSKTEKPASTAPRKREQPGPKDADVSKYNAGTVNAPNEAPATPAALSRSTKSPPNTVESSQGIFPSSPVTPSRSGRSTPSGHGTPGGGGTGTPLPPDETGDVMSGSVVNPGAEGSMIAGLGAKATGNEIDRSHQQSNLLGEVDESMKRRKCLVLDLDETLVHSSFKVMHQADFVVPVEIEQQVHNVYVIKRPGVDAFMKKMGEIYEVVVFTASLSKYADPVLDILDIHGVVRHRLFRESCFNHKGNYVKDLAMLGRALESVIIIDNSPASYIFHPNNAVPISSWFNDPHDTELTDLTPFLEDLSVVDDVRAVLEIGL